MALNKEAKESSTYDCGGCGPPGNAVDGLLNTFSHTTDEIGWWEVDLDSIYLINKIEIVNRADECCNERLAAFDVKLYPEDETEDRQELWSKHRSAEVGAGETVTFSVNGVAARYVRVEKTDKDYLHIAEVRVYGAIPSCSNVWKDSIGNNDATLMGGGLEISSGNGVGAKKTVQALEGTKDDSILFGSVINATFSICSVSRYTSSSSSASRRILQGKGANWLHGHWASKAGLAYYGRYDVDNGVGFKTDTSSTNVNPITDWAVMCGTNEGKVILANGRDVGGVVDGGQGDVELWVNGDADYGMNPSNNEDDSVETSDFAIAEVMIWGEVLSDGELSAAAFYLMDKFGIGRSERSKDSRAEQLFCMDSCPMYNLRLFNNGMQKSDTSTGVDVYVVNTSGSDKYQSKLEYGSIRYLVDHTELDECHEKEFSLQFYDNGVANADTSGLDIYVVNYDDSKTLYESKKVGEKVTYSTAECPHLTLKLFSNGTDDASTESDVDVYIINENNDNMYYQKKYRHGSVQYSSSGDWEQKFQSCDDKTSVVLVSLSPRIFVS